MVIQANQSIENLKKIAISDILQVNISEKIDKMPYKTAAIYAYAAQHCINTKWLFPTDRDIVIDFEVWNSN